MPKYGMLFTITRPQKQAAFVCEMIPKDAYQNRQIEKALIFNACSRFVKDSQKGKAGKRKQTETAESIDFIGLGNKITCFDACLRLIPE